MRSLHLYLHGGLRISNKAMALFASAGMSRLYLRIT